MSEKEGPEQECLGAWISRECDKVDDAINMVTRIRGTFLAERDPTVQFLDGYKAGLKAVAHRQDL